MKAVMAPEALVRWCKLHDWGVDARLSEDGTQILGCIETSIDGQGEYEAESVVFPVDYAVIRRWAGY